MTSPLLVVMDANVLVRAIANNLGAGAAILALQRVGGLRLVVATDVSTEYARLSARPTVRQLFDRRGITPSDMDAFVRSVLRDALRVFTTGEPPPCRDEKDRKYLHCAVTANADFLVTEDKDLLVLGTVGTTVILRSADLLARLRKTGG